MGKDAVGTVMNDSAGEWVGRTLSSIPATYTVFYDNIDGVYRAEHNKRSANDLSNSTPDWGALINSIMADNPTGKISIHTKAGTYNSATAAAINHPDVKLTGDGWATKIQASQVDPTWNLINITEDNAILRDFRLNGRASTDGDFHCIYASELEHGIFDGLYIESARNSGLLLSNSDLITILQCRSMSNRYAAYRVADGSWGIRFFLDYSENNSYFGWMLNNITDTQLIGCQSYVETRNAIAIYSSGGTSTNEIVLGENIIRRCAAGGGVVANAERAAIRVYDDTVAGSIGQDINIYGNTIYDDRVAPLMLYGVLSSSLSDHIILKNNRIRDAQTAQISLVGNHNTYDGIIQSDQVQINGATTIPIMTFKTAAYITRVTLQYSTAVANDTNVTVGYARDGAADADYYVTTATSGTGNIWATSARTLAQNAVTAGDTITFTQDGSGGAGEYIRLILEYCTGVYT